MPEQKVTNEQAFDALRQIVADRQPAQAAAEPEPEPQPAEETPAEEPVAAVEATTEAAEPSQETAPASEPGGDDVASLRQRLETIEKAQAEREAKFKEQLAAINERATNNQRILNDRFLRKATVADRALKTLIGVRGERGLPEADVDRVIQELESSMNPQSASYSPMPTLPQRQSQEDRDMAVNEFLNQRVMTQAEAADFGKWVQTEAQTAMSQSELHIADESPVGFLHLAHGRWQESLRAKANQRTEAIEAVKTVQRTQKQAARAASAAPAAPRKTTVKSTPKDAIEFDKVTPDMVSEWARASVEQYK